MSSVAFHTNGGEFASGFRCDPDALRYAQEVLNRGAGYQTASRISGVPQSTLQQMLPRSTRPAKALNVEVAKADAIRFAWQSRPISTPACESREIVSRIAKAHGYAFTDMQAEARYGKLARPRQEAMFEVFTRCAHLSLPAIGQLFKRDHTTVLHGIRKHCERIGLTYDQAKAIRAAQTLTEAA